MFLRGYVYPSRTIYLFLYVIKYNLCCIFSKNKCILDLRNETSANIYSLSCIKLTTDKLSFRTPVFFRRRKPIFLTSLIWWHINLHLPHLLYIQLLKSFLPMIWHFHLVFLSHHLLLHNDQYCLKVKFLSFLSSSLRLSHSRQFQRQYLSY